MHNARFNGMLLSRRAGIMRRREFITAIGGVAAAWPLTARAQPAGVAVAGFLHASDADRGRDVVAAFENGLKQTGYTPGENVAIEYRWADDNYDRLPELVQELASRHVAAILAATPVAALAAKRVASQIPIVFCVGSDPIKDGLVTNLARPTGNITGKRSLLICSVLSVWGYSTTWCAAPTSSVCWLIQKMPTLTLR